MNQQEQMMQHMARAQNHRMNAWVAAEVEKRIEGIRKQVSNLTYQLDDLKRLNDEQQQNAQPAEQDSELADAQTEVSKLNEYKDHLLVENNELIAENQKLQRQIKHLSVQIQQTTSAVHLLQTTNQQIAVELNDQAQQHVDCLRQLTEVKNERDKTAELAKIRLEHIEKLEAHEEALEQELKAVYGQRDAFKEKADQDADENDALAARWEVAETSHRIASELIREHEIKAATISALGLLGVLLVVAFACWSGHFSIGVG